VFDLFDNRGIGATNGIARETVEDMARDTALFVDALDMSAVDLLGHSMGGEVAQVLALARPELVRRLILVGAGPRGGEGMAIQKPWTAELFVKQYERQDEMWLPIMFAPSKTSQAAGRAYLERIRRRPDRDAPVTAEAAFAHSTAARDFGRSSSDGYRDLQSIARPTLVVNGSDDIVIPTVNAFILQQHIPNAKLVLYPDSNHGAHYQFTTTSSRRRSCFSMSHRGDANNDRPVAAVPIGLSCDCSHPYRRRAPTESGARANPFPKSRERHHERLYRASRRAS
jgi:pimeloyl-ACP methyl ester carboxylesterase